MDKVTEERYFTSKLIYSPAERIEHQKQAITLKSKDFTGNQASVFNLVANSEYWKKPTTPAIVSTLAQADRLAKIISFYLGGAEIDKVSESVYVVTSKGYYHYIKG